MIRGNKGEWSELYAFLKILTDGKVFTADKDLEILKDNFYVVLKIIREEGSGRKSYDISKHDGNVTIKNEKENLLGIVEIEKVKSKIARIFDEMKSARGSAFQVLSAEEVMLNLQCTQIRASSGKKADLVIILHDRKSPEFPELGFSIKSMLGSPSTLLNASGATNFCYRVIGNSSDTGSTSEEKILAVREKSKDIYATGDDLEFAEMDSEDFRKNLRKIDSNFPVMIAEILKTYYKGAGTKISDLVNVVSGDEEFCKKLDLEKADFVLIVKRFLSAVALGMTPRKEWDGYASAHGGYIIVKEDGEIACYHIYNRDLFEDYLYNNTKLDTPSTTRHKFGEFYRENNEKMIKYNLQIRFIR